VGSTYCGPCCCRADWGRDINCQRAVDDCRRAGRTAAASGRNSPAAAHDWLLLAAGALVVERCILDMGRRYLSEPSESDRDLGARSVDPVAERRLYVARRPLAGRLVMPRASWLAAPAVLALAACGAPAPRNSTLIVQAPAAPPATVISSQVMAPGPPPPPQSELVPPPPIGAGPVVWQPGHWRWAGASWTWISGQYLQPPPGEALWVPGRWAQQPDGNWAWIEGHWA
jgi:hypothetical protein